MAFLEIQSNLTVLGDLLLFNAHNMKTSHDQ